MTKQADFTYFGPKVAFSKPAKNRMTVEAVNESMEPVV